MNFENYCVLLRKNKNRKQQIIPLTPALVSALSEYLKYRKR
ncbi:MAG: hypothetical protein ACLTN1_08445 [Acutalibacteraceae bacterium]